MHARSGFIGLVGFIVAALLLTAVGRGQPTTLPFKSGFAAIDPGWKSHTTAGSTIKSADGWLRFESFEHSLDHLERAIESETDCVTITAKTVGCASVYLVWDDSHWIGVGNIAPTPFGRYYSVINVGATASDSLYRGIDINAARGVRIQLAKDAIRFQYSNDDGAHWRNLRAIARPAELARAPKLIAVGKQYEPGAKPFSGDDAAGAASTGPVADRGGKFTGGVREVRVEPTPENDQSMTADEKTAIANAGVDQVSKAALAGEGDPTFDAIVKFYPPFKNPREIVGVADHPLDIGVGRLGQIDVSPWEAPIATLEVGDPPKAFGSDDSPIERRLLDGYIPVLTLKTVHAGVRLEETIFGWSQGMSPDKDLIAFVRLRAIAREGTKPPTKMSIAGRDGKRRTFDMIAGSGGTSEACISFKFPNPGAAAAVGSDEFEQRMTGVVSAWRDQLKRAARFDVPDARVSEAYRAWIAYSMLNTDKKNGFMEPHDGAGFYEDIFGISVGLHSIAMDQYGLPDRAERALATLLHFQQPDGLYTQNAGLPDHGAMMVALVQHATMTGDLDYLKKVAPQLIKAGDWIIKKRSEAPKEGVTRGMIKFRPYCDYPEAVYNYYGDSFCCMGLESAADGLRKIGDTGNADRFAAEARQYRADLLTSMKSAAFKDGDMTLLPLEPETHRLLKAGRNRGGDYWGLTACTLLENDFLPANDERAVIITDTLEKRGGLIAGICEFMEGVDHAYTYGYLNTQLKRDEPRKALLGFWSMLAFGMTRDTYSPVEVSAIDTGDNQLTLPHLYSCTEQLRLLRNLMIREEGDALWLGQAIPRAWLEPGKRVAATDAPTLFGPVSFEIKGAGDSATVHLVPPTRRPPARIMLRVRDPKLRDIVGIETQPNVASEIAGETITFKNLTDPIDVTVHFGTKITPR